MGRNVCGCKRVWVRRLMVMHKLMSHSSHCEERATKQSLGAPGEIASLSLAMTVGGSLGAMSLHLVHDYKPCAKTTKPA